VSDVVVERIVPDESGGAVEVDLLWSVDDLNSSPSGFVQLSSRRGDGIWAYPLVIATGGQTSDSERSTLSLDCRAHIGLAAIAALGNGTYDARLVGVMAGRRAKLRIASRIQGDLYTTRIGSSIVRLYATAFGNLSIHCRPIH